MNKFGPIITLPNLITFLRIPLALAFLQDSIFWRATALVLAMLSDCLDGHIARRYNTISRSGTILDPFADKFFVFFVLTVLITENRLQPWEAATMLGRDFSVIVFGFYLLCKGTLAEYQFRSIWCGKITTTLQLTVLLGLTLRMSFAPFVYISFVILGLMALGELYLERKRLKVDS